MCSACGIIARLFLGPLYVSFLVKLELDNSLGAVASRVTQSCHVQQILF